jgi:tetrapyrrole methylase family protein/MazG family protein
MRKGTKFTELKKIFQILHGPKGCLWDQKQTYKTLIPRLREEVREFIAAVEKNNSRHMQEELGDLLLLVMFYAQIAAKEKRFSIEDVIAGLIKKLKRRHPHVFGKLKLKFAHQIIRNWNKIKAREKKRAK